MFSNNSNNFFNQPYIPRSFPSTPQSNGPSLNLNVNGGLPSPGLTVQGRAEIPASSRTTIWAQGGNNMPSAHPSVPSSSPLETQGSIGASIRFGTGK